MKKTKLVLASILKPVDDTRMFEKFGLSLSQTNKYDINIIGFYSKNIPTVPDITFHPVFNFYRLSLKRILAPLKCFRLLIKIRPKILIINTHELLIVTWLYKILFGCKLIYDIRENYYRNIIYTRSFPLIIRPFIAGYVRAKEYISTLFTNHYFLAEKQYEREFTFSKGKSTVIENKFRKIGGDIKREKHDRISLLFSGTIAESTGVFHAIDIAKKLSQISSKISLKIIGYCALPKTLDRVKKAIKNQPNISLQGGDHLVPHDQIIRAISQADFGIIYYPANYSTMNSTPTKLYEYLGLQLPILVQDHEPWVSLVKKHDAGIVLERDFQPENLLKSMTSDSFYKNHSEVDILWKSEAKKLLEIVKTLIHN